MRALLVAATLFLSLPPLAYAGHCTTRIVEPVATFRVCDVDGDGAADTADFVIVPAASAGRASFYEERYTNQGRIVGEFVVVTGAPFSPTVAQRVDGTDRHADGNYDFWASRGGLYTSGTGQPQVEYFLVLRDDNENRQYEGQTLVVCDSVTGCHLVL